MFPLASILSGTDNGSDESVRVLRIVFGPIIDNLSNGTSINAALDGSVLATIIGYFNTGLLSVASIIITYVSVVGVINTANDGEALGEGWSSVWTPVRIAFGGAALLPMSSGYSLLQAFVLWLALAAIGFANNAYHFGMSMGIMKPEGVAASAYQPGQFFGLRDFGKEYVSAAYCTRAANAIFDYRQQGMSAPNVTLSSRADKQSKVENQTYYTFFLKDRNPATNLGGGVPVCGSVTIRITNKTAGDNALDTFRDRLEEKKSDAIMGLMQDLNNWVSTMPASINETGWDTVKADRFNQIIKAREDQISAAIVNELASSEHATDDYLKGLRDLMASGGWAMAGAWYQRAGMLHSKISAIAAESIAAVSAPSLASLTDDPGSRLLKNSLAAVTETLKIRSETSGNGYGNRVAFNPSDFATRITTDGTSVNVGVLTSDLTGKLSSFLYHIQASTECMLSVSCTATSAMGGNHDVDAIMRMKQTGDMLALSLMSLKAAEVALDTSLSAARVAAGTVSSVEVLGTRLDASPTVKALWDWVQVTILPILHQVQRYLNYLAFFFSVALPALPTVIFAIVVVGWLLAVFQTVIAAPLWGIMHMRPARTFIGSEAQGYLLLLALFVRPVLAVAGLFGAMLLADPIVDYIAKSFFAMRGDVVAAGGLPAAMGQFFTFFDWLVMFCLQCGIVLYMIFGLPQTLPDQCLRWLNFGVSPLGSTKNQSEQTIDNLNELAAVKFLGKKPRGAEEQDYSSSTSDSYFEK